MCWKVLHHKRFCKKKKVIVSIPWYQNYQPYLVRVTGFEPAASCSQSRRATNCATPGYAFYYRWFLPLLQYPPCVPWKFFAKVKYTCDFSVYIGEAAWGRPPKHNIYVTISSKLAAAAAWRCGASRPQYIFWKEYLPWVASASYLNTPQRSSTGPTTTTRLLSSERSHPTLTSPEQNRQLPVF